MQTRVGMQLSHLKETSWKEYGARFLFGGVITAAVGVLGKAFGPVVAGLFLAFPAILPASLTLVSGQDGEKQAGMEALGAAFGSVGLVAFGVIVWQLAPRLAGWSTLAIAMATWLLVSVAIWGIFHLGRVHEDATRT